MSAYVTQSQIQGQISAPDLITALDDANPATGVLQVATLNQIIADASNEVDARCGNTYAVPFAAPYPNQVVAGTLAIACYRIYKRRLVPDEKNLFYPECKRWMDFFDSVNGGSSKLLGAAKFIDATTPRSFTPGAVALGCVAMDCNSQ